MSTFLEDITNLRYNPFTQVFTTYGYGYGANPKEVHTIPNSSPYWIYLDEIPKEDTPSTLFINEQGGGNFTEVSFTTSPAANQFRVTYGGDGTTTQTTAGQGIVEFNSADAGKIVEVKYYGLGSIVQKQFIDNILKISNPVGTIIGIHPDVQSAYLPDSEYWALCDGITALDTTYIADTNDTDVPDLTDDRFLMGDTVYGTGGSDTLSLAHNHKWYDWKDDKDQYDTTYDINGDPANIATKQYGAGVGTGKGINAIFKSTLDYAWLAMEGHTDLDLEGTQDNKPLYFSVLYYIRIK